MPELTTQKHLVLGGARSGKSAYAEQQIQQLAALESKQLVYVATATAGDQEMSDRIARHQIDRQNDDWLLIEQAIDLASVLNDASSNQCLLIDCLSLWLSNCLHQDCWEVQKTAYLDAIIRSQADVLMVSNEVGSGIVPMGELSRRFVDEIGWLHQTLAKSCDRVTLIVAGLPSKLK